MLSSASNKGAYLPNKLPWVFGWVGGMAICWWVGRWLVGWMGGDAREIKNKDKLRFNFV